MKFTNGAAHTMRLIAEEYMSKEAADHFCRLLMPAARLVASDEGPKSHLGGDPVLAEPWPTRGRRPLSLVAALYLPELAGVDVGFQLPSAGWLSFFYDAETQPWGYDGGAFAGCRVIHTAAGTGDVVDAPGRATRFDHVPMSIGEVQSHPSDHEPALLRLEDRFPEARYDLLDQRLNGPAWPETMLHQIGGWARPVQHQVGGVGLGGDRALLLQLDSDRQAGFMWGDAGMLYFTIDHDALAAGSFDEASVQLQCC